MVGRGSAGFVGGCCFLVGPATCDHAIVARFLHSFGDPFACCCHDGGVSIPVASAFTVADFVNYDSWSRSGDADGPVAPVSITGRHQHSYTVANVP